MKSYTAGNRNPKLEVDITRTSIMKYAGASGDFSPIHTDEEFAKEAGFESVFAMGTYTAAIAGTLLNQWLGVENITSFSVRFEEKVYPGDTLTYTAEIVDKEGESVEAEYSATNQDGEVVVSGSTEADLSE